MKAHRPEDRRSPSNGASLDLPPAMDLTQNWKIYWGKKLIWTQAHVCRSKFNEFSSYSFLKRTILFVYLQCPGIITSFRDTQREI